MNYNDTPEEAAFRAEVRSFIETEAPKNMARGEGFGGAGEGWKAWSRSSPTATGSRRHGRRSTAAPA